MTNTSTKSPTTNPPRGPRGWTSLGRSPRKPKESSERGRFPTAGDFAGDIEPEAAPAEEPESGGLTTDLGDSRESAANKPSYGDPAVLPARSFGATPVVAERTRGRTPKEPKPAKAPKALKEPKPAKEPKPPKPAKEPKAPKAAKEPKPAKAPKEPKAPKAARKPKPAKASKAAKPPKVPKPPKIRSDLANRRWSIAAGVAGAIGLILSVILAIGALFVALDVAQGSGFFGSLSDLCDALVGPLKDVFSFSGVNADKKKALVGWGLGSMGYLLLGRFLQSVLSSRVKD